MGLGSCCSPVVLQLWDSKSSSVDSGYEVLRLVLEDCYWVSSGWRFHGVFHDQNRLLCENPPFSPSLSILNLTLLSLLKSFLTVSEISYGYVIRYFQLLVEDDDKVTVLESEKRAWETSPEALAVKEALNPWRKHDEEAGKSS
ncbi:hypothetical protein Ddye_021805 [Dipteronia dyeriana]|uniref:Uncharacterized protein n=1 Tax=Dipteronia dyeriana TaxID=168575 RepID=A0AAD9U2C5_9ROSI|nr:hypothetical protein Ddye_021805 [Dipteronia dyeriana]